MNIGFMEMMEAIAVVLQVFQVAILNPILFMTRSIQAPGGVLRRTLMDSPGTASCTTPAAMSSEAAALRRVGSLFVASGISRACKVRQG